MATVALKYKNRFSNASNRQIGMKETMILLPLSDKFYIVFYNGHNPSYIIKDKISILSFEEVQKINDVIIENSYVECVGKYKQELERVKENEIISFGPSKCLMRYGDGMLKDHIIKREVFFYEEDWDLDTNSYTYMVKYLEKIKGKIDVIAYVFVEVERNISIVVCISIIWLKIFFLLLKMKVLWIITFQVLSHSKRQ